MDSMADGKGFGDACQLVKELAQAAAAPQIVKHPNGELQLLIINGAVAREVSIGPARHREVLETPEQLLKFLLKMRDGEVDDKTYTAQVLDSAAIFYTDTQILAVYDIDDRRDLARCPLPIAPQYAWLAKNGGQPMNQVDFVRALRIDLDGCGQNVSSLLSIVRKLRFNSGGEAVGVVDNTRQSIDRRIAAEVDPITQIPEEITLSVQVYENYLGKQPVRCAVEVFPQTQQLALTPMPLALRQAMDSTLLNIGEMFQEQSFAAFRGQVQ